jgi:hypothetical protein
VVWAERAGRILFRRYVNGVHYTNPQAIPKRYWGPWLNLAHTQLYAAKLCARFESQRAGGWKGHGDACVLVY